MGFACSSILSIVPVAIVLSLCLCAKLVIKTAKSK